MSKAVRLTMITLAVASFLAIGAFAVMADEAYAATEGTTEDGFEWFIGMDGNVSIGKYVGEGGAVVVPSEIGGIPVTRILQEAFKGKTSVTSIVIPDTVIGIYSNAFDGCTALASVVMGSNVALFGDYAFSGCCNLTFIAIPNPVTHIGAGAFMDCSGLSSVVIGSGVETIGMFAFKNTALVSVRFLGDSPDPGMAGINNLPADGTFYYYDGKSGFDDSGWGERTLEKLASFDISSASVDPIPAKAHTGSAIEPKPTVTLEGVTLIEGIDYTLDYSDNVDIGTATVSITGKGNYTESKDVTFQIKALHTITWMADGANYTWTVGEDTFGPTTVVDVGDYLVLPAVGPTKTGYEFVGWFIMVDGEYTTEVTEETVPTADAEYHAKWTAIEYTVTFDIAGGTLADGSSDDDITKDFGEQLTEDDLPVVSMVGYDLVGWFYMAGETENELTVPMDLTDDLDLYAIWAPKEYEITFNSNDGTDVDPMEVTFDAPIEAPTAPTRDGYLFIGWYTDVGLETAMVWNTYTTADNTTLYAKWDQLTITYMSDGEEVTESPVFVTYGTAPTPLAAPEKAGYTFVGWFEGGKTVAFDFAAYLEPTDHLILYAVWGYTVTFNTAEGSAVDSQVVIVGDLIIEPAEAPTKEGYAFAGWYTVAEGGIEFDFDVPPTENVTVYAVWGYTVTWTVGISVDGYSGMTSAAVPDGVILDVYVSTSPGSKMILTVNGIEGAYAEDGEYTVTVSGSDVELAVLNAYTVAWFTEDITVDGYGGVTDAVVSDGTVLTVTVIETGGQKLILTVNDNEEAYAADGIYTVTVSGSDVELDALDAYTVTWTTGITVTIDGEEDPLSGGSAVLSGGTELSVEVDQTDNKMILIVNDIEIIYVANGVYAGTVDEDLDFKVVNAYTVTWTDDIIVEDYDGVMEAVVSDGTIITVELIADDPDVIYKLFANGVEIIEVEDVYTVTVTAPVTLSVKVFYTVTFTDGGADADNMPAPIEVEQGEAFAQPAEIPTAEGVIFKAWALGGDEYVFTTPVTGNIALTAVWAIDIATTAVESIDDQAFTGEGLTPDIVVKGEGVTLVPGTDYTVAYSNNTNVGTAKVIITGIGDYAGTKTVTFSITIDDDGIKDLIEDNEEPAFIMDYDSAANLEIDNTVFQELADAGKALTVDVTDDEGNVMYSWVFDGEYDEEATGTFRAGISVVDEPDEEIIAAVTSAGAENPFVLSFDASGKLPVNAAVKYHVGDKYESGATLTLYFFNEDTGKLEAAGQGLVVDADGFVKFSPPHFSLYVLAESVPGPAPDESSSNLMLYVAIGAVILAAIVAAVILRKQ